jgi:hypothetical protein
MNSATGFLCISTLKRMASDKQSLYPNPTTEETYSCWTITISSDQAFKLWKKNINYRFIWDHGGHLLSSSITTCFFSNMAASWTWVSCRAWLAAHQLIAQQMCPGWAAAEAPAPAHPSQPSTSPPAGAWSSQTRTAGQSCGRILADLKQKGPKRVRTS